MQKVEHIGLKPVGEPGPTLLISGRWNVNKEYIRDSEVIPLVEHEGLFYSLNKVGTFKGGLNPKDDYAKYGAKATWKLQNSYEMIIVKAIVADGGLLGDFVFWGSKMFSKQGVDRQGKFSDSYTEYPKGNFIPNHMVDAITGEIISLKGKFGLLEIVGNTLIGTSNNGDELVRITGDVVPSVNNFSVDFGQEDSSIEGFYEEFVDMFSVDYNSPTGNLGSIDTEIDEEFEIFEGGEYKIENLTLMPLRMIDARLNRDMMHQFKFKFYIDTYISMNKKSLYSKEDTYTDYQDGVSPEFFAEEAGTVRLYARIKAVVITAPEGDYRGTYAKSIRGLLHKPTPRKCTYIGRDGLYTSHSTQDFLHYKANEGITMRAGSFGLRITKTGIQKWNGSKWIAANI